MIFNNFDANADGQISYDEFVGALRVLKLSLQTIFDHFLKGELNEYRNSLVKRAYQKLEKNGDGKVTIDDIKMIYNARKHPKVISGERTQDEVLKEYLNNFDVNRDGELTLEEFEKYYAGVSASIDRDEYFALMMFNAWQLGN